MHRAKPVAILLLALLALAPLAAPAAAQPLAPARLTLDRLFLDREFAPKRFGPARWLADGSGYTTLQPSPAFPGDDARDIVRFDPATGRREVLVSAAQLVPPAGAPGEKPGEKPAGKAPLEIDDYEWSADGKKLLVFTNTRRVWRQNTRGDYWVLDRATGRLAKLGGREAEPSTLMFAKFSPDGDARRLRPREQPLRRRPGHRRGPGPHHRTAPARSSTAPSTGSTRRSWTCATASAGARRPAHRLLAARRARRAGLPPDQQHRLALPGGHAGPVPQGGRAELRRARRRRDRRRRRDAVARRPGRPAQQLHRPHGVGGGQPRGRHPAHEPPAEHARRDARRRRDRPRDDGAHRARRGLGGRGRRPPLARRRQALHLDQRARRLAPRLCRPGGPGLPADTRLLTPGPFDVIEVEHVDEKGGLALLHRLARQRRRSAILFRTRSTAAARPSASRRRASAARIATRSRPTGAGRFHVASAFGRPPVTDLVRAALAPAGARRSRTTRPCARRSRRSPAAPSEFFRVDIGDGAPLDGWVMKPPRLRPGQALPGALPRLRRAGRPDGRRPLGRHQLPLAPDADAAGLRRRQRRQPRHAGAARPRLAQGRSTGRSASWPTQDQAAAARAIAEVAVRGLDAHRRLGLERRRLDDAER